LIDKTGQVDGHIWQVTDEITASVTKSPFVRVTGRVITYNGRLQVTVSAVSTVDPAEIQVEDYLPVTPKDRAVLLAEIRAAIVKIANPFLRKLLESFWSDSAWLDAFTNAPAAKMHHQPYLGGLLEHTTNILRLIPVVCSNYLETDQDLLVSGAILHDIGKIQEYEYQTKIGFTDAGHFLGHIVLGLKMVEQVIAEIPDFPKELELKLLHMIASHHGQYEWQSPKRPKIIEACLLHHLDLMDGEAFKFAKTLTLESAEDWLWEKSLERWVYVGEKSY
jgi:3'-5' exoribonuclease